MMFLKDLGITEDTIQMIKKENPESILYQFVCDEENAREVILFFQQIGILAIDELLIHRLELFSIDYIKIQNAFEQYNQEVLVQLINEDIHAIDFL